MSHIEPKLISDLSIAAAEDREMAQFHCGLANDLLAITDEWINANAHREFSKLPIDKAR